MHSIKCHLLDYKDPRFSSRTFDCNEMISLIHLQVALMFLAYQCKSLTVNPAFMKANNLKFILGFSLQLLNSIV